MKENSNKQIINWLLILQGWAILWVVIGHSCLGLFMLISGYLFHYTRLSKLKDVEWSGMVSAYKSLIYSKMKRLMIPFVFFASVVFLLKMSFPGEMARQASITKLSGDNRWIAILAATLLYAAGFFTISFFKTIGGIVISISLAQILDQYLPKIFNSFRNYTYQIFLMGIFAQMFDKILFRHLAIPYVPAYIICLLMGLYVPVIVSKILQKINWNPLLYCVGLSPSR